MDITKLNERELVHAQLRELMLIRQALERMSPAPAAAPAPKPVVQAPVPKKK